MRRIEIGEIKKVVSQLCIQANTVLRKDVLEALKGALREEKNRRASRVLGAIIRNASLAKRQALAICQDTGLPLAFIQIGQDVKVSGGDLNEALNQGIKIGYKKGYLRHSTIYDPIKREGRFQYSPGIIHYNVVKGNRLRITVLPKGFGCENKSQIKMFKPTDTIKDIEGFIIEVVRKAGPDACPPFIIGVGMGGTQDKACLLAKEALLRRIDRRSPKEHIAKLEERFLKKINRLNIGPMGLGGKTTCLGVNILTCPTHIAGLPLAVNISCHALRSATRLL